MDLEIIFLLLGGLAVLTLGADVLVRGAIKIAAFFGISSLVTGLTVVAFGTSAPELAVSLSSSLDGNADIALGNVVGSNICNVLLILGLSAIILPLTVHRQLIRLDVPLMIVLSMLVFVFGRDGSIGRVEGLIFFSVLIAYTVLLIRMQKKEPVEVRNEYDAEFRPPEPIDRKAALLGLMQVIVGLGLLVVGADWMVTGAVKLARSLGVSELMIGLTIVAVGTSLPEIATSIVAAFKGERDIAVGNVIGSNIFNILSVLGLSAAISPSGVAVSGVALSFDIPVMIAVAVLCLPVFFTGSVISRTEGLLFLFFYASYVIFLAFEASGHEALDHYRFAMIWIVIPLTLISVTAATIRYAMRIKTEKIP